MNLKLIGGENKKLTTVVELTSRKRALKVGRALVGFMKRKPCLGVAANQFGIMERVCTAKILDHDRGGSHIRMFIDPHIIERSGHQYEKEGCLTWPGVTGYVKRPKQVTVEFTFHHPKIKTIPESWEQITETFTGRDAIVMEHEIDHLDGIRCIDKMVNRKDP